MQRNRLRTRLVPPLERRVVRSFVLTGSLLLLSCSSSGDGTPSSEPPDVVLDQPAIRHVIITGQSNAIGFAARPPLSTTPSTKNFMFDTGVITATDCDDDGCTTREEATKLVPLVEGDTYAPLVAEPAETIASSFAEAGGKNILVSNHARSGNTYQCLRKGGCDFFPGKGYVMSFDDAMTAVKDGRRLANADRRPYVLDAVHVIHGESDHYNGSASGYADLLIEWQRDYDAEGRALSGQFNPVLMFISQMANWNDRETSEIPIQQLAAHVRAPGKVIMVGATYMLPIASDCIHFTNEGERLLGRYFAKAYRKVIDEQATWEPVRPKSIALDGASVVVQFHVPSPPLVIDTSAVSDPGANGFDFQDGTVDPPVIDDVALEGADTIRITLSKAPAGAEPRLRYAIRATPQTCPGPQTGPRGNVRDSDDLANWSVSFDLPVE